MFYKKETQKTLFEQNKGIKISEAMRLLSDKWKAMPADQRKKYELMATKDRQQKEKLRAVASQSPTKLSQNTGNNQKSSPVAAPASAPGPPPALPKAGKVAIPKLPKLNVKKSQKTAPAAAAEPTVPATPAAPVAPKRGRPAGVKNKES